MENGPHYFWVVDLTCVISDVQTEDDLVQLRVFNSDTLVSKWWWQLSQEIWKSKCTHVELSHWVVFCPCALEGLDVLFLETEDVVLIFRGLNIIEIFIDDGNENIHENEESQELEEDPVYVGHNSFSVDTFMHDAVPRFSSASSPKSRNSGIE